MKFKKTEQETLRFGDTIGASRQEKLTRRVQLAWRSEATLNLCPDVQSSLLHQYCYIETQILRCATLMDFTFTDPQSFLHFSVNIPILRLFFFLIFPCDEFPPVFGYAYYLLS